MVWGSNFCKTKNVSLLTILQICSGAHSASYSTSTGIFSRGKVPWVWCWPLTSIYRRDYEWVKRNLCFPYAFTALTNIFFFCILIPSCDTLKIIQECSMPLWNDTLTQRSCRRLKSSGMLCPVDWQRLIDFPTDHPRCQAVLKETSRTVSWRRKEKNPSKGDIYLFTSRHNVTYQKMWIFSSIAARTSHRATEEKLDKSGVYVILIQAFKFPFSKAVICESL